MNYEADLMISNGYNEAEEKPKPKIEVITLAEDGLGFGEGPIGVLDRLGDPNDGLSPEIVQATKDIIHAQRALVEVDKDDDGRTLDDDGCPDGRETGAISQGDKVFKKSLHRAKVFGGSVTMGFASIIGLDKADEMPADEVFSLAADQLEGSNIDYGAHSDTHSHGADCGCGAIDKHAEHIIGCEKYRDQISHSVYEILRASGFSHDRDEREIGSAIDDSLDRFREYGHHLKPAQGNKILQRIKDKFKVVKKLDGDHREIRVVLNMVPGYTIDQEMIRKGTDENAQVFAVDGWRMQDVVKRNKSIPEDEKDQAFISQLIYSLAVASTLTKGDLPVDLLLPTS